MKKDIDLLGGFNEAKGKKNSSNSSLILVIGVIVIIGVMIFLFASAKMEIADKQDVIAGLDNELKKEQTIAPTQQKIEVEKQQYKNMVTEILLRLNSGVSKGGASEISSELFTVIFDDYLTKYHDGKDGEYITTRVIVDSFNIGDSGVTISCKSRNWEDAWDFVDYLSGNAKNPPVSDKVTGYVPTDADKESFKAQVEKNKAIFKGVQDNYPGLPVQGEGEEYNISFTLTFEVVWEELAV